MVEHALKISGLMLGWYAFRHVKKARLTDPTIPLSKITVIVPARNESRNLRALLPSLARAGLDDVIVVNDQSEDDTAEIARGFGCQVLDAAALPPGWTGKTWACCQGARVAKRAWLLFLDADCTVEPGARWGSVETRETVFSYLPYHRVSQPYEQLSSFFNLLMAAGVMTKPAKLFGQCLLIQRETYLSKTSHERVSDKVLENLHLADDLLAEGIEVRSFCGEGVVSMRMFPEGPRQMHQSWLKAFASGATRVRPPDLVLIIGWISIASYAGYSALFTPGIAALVHYALYAAQIHSFQRRVGSYRGWSALGFVVPLTYFHLLFTFSAVRKFLGISVAWRGRRV